ncbi:hypothetical protein Dalk_4592 [Desulfatibacillum aliphaticivorans]|uniref:Uncharacterized protein n=1 Tax=Desulfatibacillum aliphaticivorans TaxID=218208 RepID=B8FNI9_DESAL|nr:hypothetical protein [Desulfatibacillum aliphaticivorans]ACL06270.1 hypothetical protein Dalk_4592 [Desulfatibacillum aliphaticivorans]
MTIPCTIYGIIADLTPKYTPCLCLLVVLAVLIAWRMDKRRVI